jgi:hypothetical protein
MLKFNKHLIFTEEELKQLRMALIGNNTYNDLEWTKEHKMTMLPADKTKELSEKIRQHFILNSD